MKKKIFLFVLLLQVSVITFSQDARAISQWQQQNSGGGNAWSTVNGFQQLINNFIANPLVPTLIAVGILVLLIKLGQTWVKYGYKSTNNKYGWHKQFHAGGGGGGGDKPKEEKKA